MPKDLKVNSEKYIENLFRLPWRPSETDTSNLEGFHFIRRFPSRFRKNVENLFRLRRPRKIDTTDLGGFFHFTRRFPSRFRKKVEKKMSRACFVYGGQEKLIHQIWEASTLPEEPLNQ